MPNPGRMGELLLPDVELILADHGVQALRKTRYTVMAVRYQGRIVFLHTHLNNTVARRLIESRAIPALKEYGIAGTEVTVGGNRFDFLLKDAEGALCLEVKSCTLSANGIAMFPDAVTERGRRHLESLAGMCSAGERGALLFLIHHESAGLFLPDYHTDYAFSLAFRDVENKLPVHAVSIEWTEDLRYRIACPGSGNTLGCDSEGVRRPGAPADRRARRGRLLHFTYGVCKRPVSKGQKVLRSGLSDPDLDRRWR